MKYQLLVSTMNQTDAKIADEMRIDSSAIIINQADRTTYDCISNDHNKIDIYTFAERGVGLSRNSALMRAEAEIIEFADDDMIFVKNYEQLVVAEFEAHPEADAIIFSIESLNPDRPCHHINGFSRVRRLDARKYGCARIAVRREKLLYHNIYFSLLFGGGTKYGAGEDTLFIKAMMDAGLKIYKSPIKVADVKQDGSSWFNGYNEKYYFDKGALMAAMYPTLCGIVAVVMACVHSKLHLRQFNYLFRTYRKGIKNYREKC